MGIKKLTSKIKDPAGILPDQRYSMDRAIGLTIL